MVNLRQTEEPDSPLPDSTPDPTAGEHRRPRDEEGAACRAQGRTRGPRTRLQPLPWRRRTDRRPPAEETPVDPPSRSPGAEITVNPAASTRTRRQTQAGRLAPPPSDKSDFEDKEGSDKEEREEEEVIDDPLSFPELTRNAVLAPDEWLRNVLAGGIFDQTLLDIEHKEAGQEIPCVAALHDGKLSWTKSTIETFLELEPSLKADPTALKSLKDLRKSHENTFTARITSVEHVAASYLLA
ncbi:hypothetical protein BDK51DRAFT_50898 [Blyttiomyces helicus]|uniref:Uncharacterized protein n=1 Tax=Blyttiomyces helicus TaxID=388810 RepID=A0A4P9VZY5_9FUNG|nr:hypothetical protein BDK51DRAFT_50898 [Blyttiomyces helicus]|eukprot:RKO84605.1 hypothetical protein BDK51DRAFT_50898 [Blyttiomyces helicus]